MKFMLRYLLMIPAIFFLLTPNTTHAQEEEVDKEKVQKELESFMEEFSSAYASLPTTKNKDAVLKYFAKDATSNLFVFNITGKSRVTNSDYKGFDAYLTNLLRSSKLDLTYDIGNIAYTYLSTRTSTLVYTVDYEIKEENGIWVKGKETVTMALEKMGKSWKIVHYTIMQVEDEKLKGTCLCELFVAEGDNGEVVAKTTIPSGRTYSKKFDNFEFRMMGEDQLIKVGDYLFKRTKSNELLYLSDEEEIPIGVAVSKKDAVLSIIERFLYKESCARLKTKTN